ncbi:MAG: thioredoxin domain-containing protein [Pirellulaceae bacterium]|jgi:thioredoxin 1|nr:thioredoxin domain-containing protein [Pirellulaceae bacterium]
MEVTDETFAAEVMQHQGVVLVDFWASWCPPCKMMQPMVEKLSREYNGSTRIVSLNIDRNPRAAADHQISNVPTFVAFCGGRRIAAASGAQTEGQLRKLIVQAETARDAA